MFHYSGFGCGWGGQAVQKAMNKSQNAYLIYLLYRFSVKLCIRHE